MEWNVHTACEYVARTQLLDGGPLDAEEIGDGNLNLVFRVFVRREPTRSVILKQAPPYIKVLGPEYPLTQERLAIEAKALKLYHELAPGSVPEPYLYDEEAHLILMEDLRGYRILRTRIIEGDIRPSVAASVGAFMGWVHHQTHAEEVSPLRRRKYERDFANPLMQKITADYVFTKPFRDDPTNWNTPGLEPTIEAIRQDEALLTEIRRLRERFLLAQEGLVHGDLHTGSVMVRGDDARVMDAEFAFYGPIAFDVGAFIANYLLAWYAQADSRRESLMECIRQCWSAYQGHFGIAPLLDDIWRESIQFAGVKMLRRILGAAHVQDLESIEDVARRRASEERAIACGRSLILDPPSFPDLPGRVQSYA